MVGPFDNPTTQTYTSPVQHQLTSYTPTTQSATCTTQVTTLPTTQVTVHAYGVKVTGITIVSGATQSGVTGASNWAAVKSNDYAIAQVSIDPDTAAAATRITWSTGEAVTGQPKQRKIPLSSSAKITVKATGNDDAHTSASLDLWVLWATIDIQTSGSKPAGAPNFSHLDGTQTLGPVTYGNLWGAGKMCGVVKLTPSGVGAVVTSGWDIKRDRISRDYVDSGKSLAYWEETWHDDDTTDADESLTPDTQDQLYVIDNPNVGPAATFECETNNNFREYLYWNGRTASDYAPWHYHAKWQVAGGVQTISPNDVGTGAMTLPPY
jgi:hypothetical protein